MSAVLTVETDREQILSYNPATGEEVGRVPQTSAEDVRSAVKGSRAAFQSWRKTSFAQRRALIMKARDVILAQVDELATLISAESGKPEAEAISMEITPVLD